MNMEGLQDPKLRELSQELSFEWQSLASFLGLKAVEISVLKMDFPGQTENQIFNMLVRWRQKLTSDVDQVAVLCAALKKIKRTDLAQQLRGSPISRAGSQPQAVEGLDRRITDMVNKENTTVSNLPNEFHPIISHQPQEGPCEEHGACASLQEEIDMMVNDVRGDEVHDVNMSLSTSGETNNCLKHAGETYTLMCMTCDELICERCSEDDHGKPKHHCITCEAASEKYRPLLANKVPVLGGQIEEIREFLADASRVRDDFEKKVSRTVKKVREKASRVIAEVQAEEKRLIEEVKKLEVNRGKTFHEQEKRATVLLRVKQHALETASDITKLSHHPTFLSQYLMISKVVDMMNDQHCPQSDPKLSYLSFKESPGVGNMGLGRLELGGTWIKYHQFGSKGSGPGEFGWAKGIAARWPGEIEVADFINKRLVAFSTEGNALRTIPIQGVPRDIAALRTQLAVVDDTSHVQLYTKDNMVASVAGKRKCDFRSVAIRKDGTVVVGDVSKNVLTEHNRNDGSLKRIVYLKIKPYFVAVGSGSAFRERLVISGGFQKEVHVVDSRNETLLFIIRPLIDGQPVYQCTGVCCDTTCIYVAVTSGERDQGHVHQYDAHGAFVVCVAQGLHNPQGITFTADGHQLAVADTYSVKIYHKI
ncbi:uncharacterized protein LOC110983516 [Acanthaster planci]|uniref:Uncharacterized protein LOC110983516 n=1 Tax=Acanthaster planci TaxID=133434 RepID=A0A8B7YYU3_ACAPL|nr:uncharacterized protein LOC110983516 [Acanthaster planci]